ncbi:Eco57I restriction-modification methylase domain-containing protein [Azospirillum brasilense]|uniref:Eco57I restriction-modification methylase domain-containing protein n=1 Tax=Azospirillum brasilense TaxID=192 RepID=UPI000E6A8D62|nr:TaqI-like C-terminal specificity domain-containing protein [Azospirillum brasilense]NUB23341.1 N-6 DNA methylase [Azospirillum brasilense]NUB30963.1 N-6 DNA methylase [Azospirillum brasilense]RIW05654.1 hypothetical protein D2T81_07360 [Azospirillum brasilense]
MSNDHEWLHLIEVSGPFLAEPVLREVFPQGLDELASGRSQRMRHTYEEWRDAVDTDDPDLPALHAAWVEEVLVTALEMDDGVLRRAKSLPDRLTVSIPDHGATVSPDLAAVNPSNGDEPLLLIHVHGPDTDLDAARRFDSLVITPADRMVALLRATGCAIGVVTNGERWMLVHAPVGAVASFANWYARLWGQEPETLRAFVSLLSIRRFFGPKERKLTALYEWSLKHQDDVTEALGEQVRRAVEVLVQALDRADQDRSRELLRDIDPQEIYEAGLTVMMRLVFLLAAEERGLLLLGDPRYDSFYAVSSLRMQLRADSEEILERRRSAWSRLLTLFRGVYGGIDHPTLHLPALGGSLFDPDRYPFLEGRNKGTSWRSDRAEPLPIDDRTVLLLLEAIQTFEGHTLSYRALDVEQIGHVYEGLLERTVERVNDVTLELESGVKAKSPRVTLGEVESALLDGAARLTELLKERSERSESAVRNALERTADDRLSARLLTVCRGDAVLRDRLLPYAALLRTDPWGYPLVHHSGAFVVVLGADRRDSGTHYTPRCLTEKIVEDTLTPLVYHGLFEGKAPEDWELKSAEELLNLKICDPAVGSGAFLVQACRWLSNRLVKAWSAVEATGRRIDSEGRILGDSDAEGSELLSQDPEDRVILAGRLIAERCLYGVDKNPLAVELAKLSLWLTTMSKGRPFGFLDHNLRSGDSLLGISDLNQVVELDMNAKGVGQLRLFGRTIKEAVSKALDLRKRLRDIPVRDIHDVRAMGALDALSRHEVQFPAQVADALVGICMNETNKQIIDFKVRILASQVEDAGSGNADVKEAICSQARDALSERSSRIVRNSPFHWPLEFPEVFSGDYGGFDCVIGNPPWGAVMGNKYKSWMSFNFRYVGDYETAMAFAERAGRLCKPSASVSLILPNTVLLNDSAKELRSYLAEHTVIRSIMDLTDAPIFRSANVRCCVIHFSPAGNVGGKIRYSTSLDDTSESDGKISQTLLRGRPHWAGLNRQRVAIPDHLPRIDDIFHVKQGYIPYRKTTLQKKFGSSEGERILSERLWHSEEKVSEDCVRELRGRDVSPFSVEWSGLWVKYGPWVSTYLEPKWFVGDRVLVREIVGSEPYLVIAARTSDQFVHNPSIICLKQKEGGDLHGVLSLYLNSSLASEFVSAISAKAAKGMFPKILVKDLRDLPFLDPNRITSEDKKKAEEISKEIHTSRGREIADEFISALFSKQ